jgi:hypothetical protein
MAREFTKHPDLLPVVLDQLQTTLGHTVAGDLTGWTAPNVWITIQSTGGSIARIRTGSVRYDVNVYAPSKPEAFDISMDTIKAVMELLNYTSTNFVVTDVACSYPADISDPINSNPRFVFDVTVSYRTKIN